MTELMGETCRAISHALDGGTPDDTRDDPIEATSEAAIVAVSEWLDEQNTLICRAAAQRIRRELA